MAKKKAKRKLRPAQKQHRQPGLQSAMRPPPRSTRAAQKGCGKLEGRVALITGGDSGIGRAVAIAFAREGADVAVSYLDEEQDARETSRQVRKEGRRCVLFAGDVGDEAVCAELVEFCRRELGRLDILVNNAAEQHPREKPERVTSERVERTFRTNVFAFFHVTRAALPPLRRGSSILNTTSVTAYRGSPHLLD
jgi:NAD(P)-dependent dehydrogenase (short-subunit alcohol dehydrogenase family)